jgi:hypothetical protein
MVEAFTAGREAIGLDESIQFREDRLDMSVVVKGERGVADSSDERS